MRNLIFILTTLLVAFAQANFYPVGKEKRPTYRTQLLCEQAEKVDCFNVIDKDHRFLDVEEDVVDDKEKPLYGPKYSLESCSTPEACADILRTKKCTGDDLAGYEKNAVMPGYSAYCKTLSGYEKKVEKRVVVNQAKKDSILAQDAEELKQQQELAQVQKDANFGNYLIAYVTTRVRKKSLNLAQTKQTLADYSEVVSLLKSGSITFAKEEIQGLTPDGNRITQEDKDAILAEINEYLK